MKHITKIKELYEQTILWISESDESWKQFLTCMGRLYQLDFLNTCMVYAQRPDATVLAGYEAWQEMDLAVMRGSKGIAVFPSKLFGNATHVYDIEDVRGQGIRPWNWQVNGSNRRQLAKELFPEIYEKEKKFKNAINAFTRTYVWSMIEGEDEIKKSLQKVKILVGEEAEEKESQVTEFLVNSVCYAVESRCHTADNTFDFSFICQYQEQEEIIYRIGRLISHMSGRIILQIAKTMKNIDLERRQYYGRDYRNSVQGSKRSADTSVRRRDERGQSAGNTEPVRENGSTGVEGERSGTLRDAVSDREPSSKDANSGDRSGSIPRFTGGEPGRTVESGGQSKSVQHYGDGKSEDTSRHGGNEDSDRRSDSPVHIEENKESETEGTALAVPFTTSDIAEGELNQAQKEHILLHMTREEEKQQLSAFFWNNPDMGEREEYLYEIYGDEQRKDETEEFELKVESGSSGFYVLWSEGDSMLESYWDWEDVCKIIDTKVKAGTYLSLVSVSEVLADEEEKLEEPKEKAKADELSIEKLQALMESLTETFYVQAVPANILKQMICQVYTTNQSQEEKSQFLKALLTKGGEEESSYHMVRTVHGKFEFHIKTEGVRISMLDDSEEQFTNVEFDWWEFGDLTTHLAETNRIDYEENQERLIQELQMYQMLPWFLNIRKQYAELLEKEAGLSVGGEVQDLVERGAIKVSENPYHITMRKKAVEIFFRECTALVPYQGMLYEFFQKDIPLLRKTEFLQCLLTEANQMMEQMIVVDHVPVLVWIEDNLVRISYEDAERNCYEQLISYEEIAQGIQEAVEKNSFLTQEEYELSKMGGYAFAGEIAISLWEEFQKKSWEASVSRMEPQEEMEEESIGEEQESVSAEEQSFIPTEDYFYPEGWKQFQGGDKSRYQRNVEAIKTLKRLERERRGATKEEQEVLAGYVGWGGLPNAFSSKNPLWKKEYKELKELLDKEEYTQARASVTTSFFTPPEVTHEIYHALEQFGFQKGKILEPSMGIGNFYHALPKNMRESELYGVELDPISGRIARCLHPSADIQIKGFEKTTFEDNSFDVVVGNVPFGDFRVYDPRYKKRKLKIHDYFIAKSLDLLRPGGILAVVTSKGTLDKADARTRKELAKQADLLGAVRLPADSFGKSANTKVTSDLLFFQKKAEPSIAEPIWTYTGLTEEQIPVNEYFLEHPEMMLGKMEWYDGFYGKDSKYTALINHEENFNLQERLAAAIEELPKNRYREGEAPAVKPMEYRRPAPSDVTNFTFTVLDDEVYYREGEYLYRSQAKESIKRRIRGMHKIRLMVREVLRLQMENCSDEELHRAQQRLNQMYDAFVQSNGHFSDRTNRAAFRQDNDYPLLTSLEVIDEDKQVHKADIFFQRTIKSQDIVEQVENAYEALHISLAEYNRVDIPYMLSLYSGTRKELFGELQGAIYQNPTLAKEEDPNAGWETADEYLSGNVRQKLRIARIYAQNNPLYVENVEALEKVQPKDLTAGEISVKLGTTWISNKDYEQFLYDMLEVPEEYQRQYAEGVSRAVTVERNDWDMSYHIEKGLYDTRSILAQQTYGTERIDALSLTEEILNSRMVTIRDRKENGEQVRYVINRQETMLAREKAEQIKECFREWIFKDSERRKKYVDYYNETFNCDRQREYNGEYLQLPGLNPILQLRSYQKNAVARALLCGGNTLLSHAVGAGKSLEMICICMEMRRLGIATKPIITVPNHLTFQMGSEFLRAYPNAKVLVTRKEDFQKENRRRMIARIATGDYDCIIIGHTQFQRIAISPERHRQMMEAEAEELTEAIAKSKAMEGQYWTIKQMEAKKAKLLEQIETLSNEEIKDDVLYFEETGVNALFIDEAHLFKNLSIFSKMNNVAGISSGGSQRAMDMRLKTQYVNEINNGTGVIMATGTPISNSMTELYVMQLYLQEKRLKEKGIYNFDAWASVFGEVTTSLELAPEGTGYRMRTRFNKFINLPELMQLFREVADIILPDMLDIERPKLKNGKYVIVESEASEYVKEKMEEMVRRAEVIHNGLVDPQEDNMLKLTGEARLLGTDPRLLDADAPVDKEGKLNKAIENIYQEYVNSTEQKGTQIVFSDIGTPGPGKKFTVYGYLKQELIKRGIPEEEICFIHDATTDEQRDRMFSDVRAGRKRIIIGSTGKLGVGTNIQNRMVAAHHIDCPWRPSDIEQREGRIIRQGNENKEVNVYRYVTKNSFDAYLWGIVETKQRFISQILTSKELARSCEDVDEIVLNFAEIKAIASGNPLILERIEVEQEIARLRVLKMAHTNKQFALQDLFTYHLPRQIRYSESVLQSYLADIEQRERGPEVFEITFWNQVYHDRKEAGEALQKIISKLSSYEEQHVGSYKGFELRVKQDIEQCYLIVKGCEKYGIELKKSASGNMIRLENVMNSLEEKVQELERKIAGYEQDIKNAKLEYEKPFPYEEQLKEKIIRQTEIDSLLEIKEQQEEMVEGLEESVLQQAAAR